MDIWPNSSASAHSLLSNRRSVKFDRTLAAGAVLCLLAGGLQAAPLAQEAFHGQKAIRHAHFRNEFPTPAAPRTSSSVPSVAAVGSALKGIRPQARNDGALAANLVSSIGLTSDRRSTRLRIQRRTDPFSFRVAGSRDPPARLRADPDRSLTKRP